MQTSFPRKRSARKSRGRGSDLRQLDLFVDKDGICVISEQIDAPSVADHGLATDAPDYGVGTTAAEVSDQPDANQIHVAAVVENRNEILVNYCGVCEPGDHPGCLPSPVDGAALVQPLITDLADPTMRAGSDGCSAGGSTFPGTTPVTNTLLTDAASPPEGAPDRFSQTDERPDAGMYTLAAKDIAHESGDGGGGFCGRRCVPEEDRPMKYSKFTDIKPLVDNWQYNTLKKATDLQKEYGLGFMPVAVMDFEELAEKFDEMGVKDPDRIARTLISTLYKISVEHPGAGIPQMSKIRQLWNAAIPLREEPRQLRTDLATAYRGHKRENRPDDVLPDEERSLQTLFIHNRRTRAFMAALRRAPAVRSIGPTFGVIQMTHPKLAKLAFAQMKDEGYSATTISMIGYSVVALLRAVGGEEHPHLGWWLSYLAAAGVYPPKALPFERVHQIQQLLANGGVALLMDASQRIAARSNGATLDRKDRTARLAYAVAASLKMNHLAMSETAITCFDLKKDIVTDDRQKFVIVTTPDGRQFRETITAETDRLIDQLVECRNETDLSHNLLFPRRDELYPKIPSNADAQLKNTTSKTEKRFRAVSPVMQGLYSEIRAATGISSTFAEIKDLMVEFLLEQGVSPFIVAKRTGYANERSMRLRHQHLFKAGLLQPRLQPDTLP